MALVIRLTPQVTLQWGDTLTPDILNALANPTIDLVGTITASTIGDNSVTTQKLLDLAVTTQKLANLSVTNPKLGPQSVTEDKIAPLAVGTAEIALQAVGRSQLDMAGLAFVGTNGGGDGVAGFVTAPKASDFGAVFTADGSWQPLFAPETTLAAFHLLK